METWNIAQEHEKNWWGNCANTLGEEIKQVTYADCMGLEFIPINGNPFIIDLKGKMVADIGGGPVSLLLKTINGKGVVFDPCDYPKWVEDRYWIANVEHIKLPGEEIDTLPYDITGRYDEVWIYNCLQHTKDPEKIIQNAKKMGKVIRIFEWIDAEQNEMHPHVLTEEKLNNWLGGKGKVEDFDGLNGLFGKGYYGTF